MVLHRMHEVQLCQRGLRARTKTINGPNRGGHCIIFFFQYLGITNKITRTAYPNNLFLLTKKCIYNN